MSGHRRYLELAASSIDFALTLDESRELGRHLAGCPACARAAEGYRADADALARVTDVAAHDHVRTAVVAAASVPAGGRRSRVALILAATLAVALAAIGTLSFGSVLLGLRDARPPVIERVDWSRIARPTAMDPDAARGEILGLAFHGSRFIAGGVGPGGALLWSSEDATTWTATTHPSFARGRINAVSAGPVGIVAAGSSVSLRGQPRGAVWWSPDLGSWTRTDFDRARSLDAALSVGSVLIVGGSAADDGVPIWTSLDGRTWGRAAEADGFQNSTVVDIALGGAGFVAVGYDDRGSAAWTTVDGITWERFPGDPTFDLTQLAAVAGRPDTLVAVGADARGPVAWTSTNGSRWTPATFADQGAPGVRMAAVTATGAGLVAVGNSSRGAMTWASVDGLEWRRLPDRTDVAAGTIQSLAVRGADIIAAGRQGQEAAIWRAIVP